MEKLFIIHTAFESAFVALTEGDRILSFRSNDQPKEHGSFLHQTMNELLKENQLTPKEIAGVGVTLGPGSYTGIRVGLAAAKGFCFAMNIPLMGCNTLEALASSAITLLKKDAIYIPLVNARRMEFYSAAYDAHLKELANPSLCVISENSFDELIGNKIIFGKGSLDVKTLFPDKSIRFIDVHSISPESALSIFWKKYLLKDFISVEDSAPLYLKEAYIQRCGNNF